MFWYSIAVAAIIVLYGEYNMHRMKKLKSSLDQTSKEFRRTIVEISTMVGAINLEENRRNDNVGDNDISDSRGI